MYYCFYLSQEGIVSLSIFWKEPLLDISIALDSTNCRTWKDFEGFPVKAIMYHIDDHSGAKTTGGLDILMKISKSIRLAKNLYKHQWRIQVDYFTMWIKSSVSTSGKHRLHSTESFKVKKWIKFRKKIIFDLCTCSCIRIPTVLKVPN